MATAALPAARPLRPRTTVIAGLLASAAVFVGFSGLVALYVARRADALAAGRDWIPEGSLELGPPGMVLWTLVLSVFTVHWAVQAMGRDDRTHSYVALALTAVFGAAVLNQMWFIYTDVGYAIDGGEAQLFFYVLTGAFVALQVVALVMVAVTLLRALAGNFGSRERDVLWSTAIFWDVMAFAYALVWYVVFITK